MIEVHDWAQIERTFPYVDAMRNCIQDSVHHAEGDVWTHTRMVMDALAQPEDRILRLTTLYHDVHKPQTRVEEYDPEQSRVVVRHPHHARLGAATAWYDLWLAGEDTETRLAVYWLCMWHQKVFHMWSYADMLRAALSFACVGSWAKLIDFALADNAGRHCANPQQAVDNLSLLSEWLHEHDIREGYWRHDWDRLFYFEKIGRTPLYPAQQPQGSRVVILCGLPGVGKDTHCNAALSELPIVSLDAIRGELQIDPADNQGRVIQAAFEQARVFLREKKSFVWNAQCINRLSRGKIIQLCRDYDAHVTIHAFDADIKTIIRQNNQRSRQVPLGVIMASARKWEPPSLLEAHQVEWV